MPWPSYFAESNCAAYVTVCDECRAPVSMFKLNEDARAACVPCGHPAHVSIVPGKPLPIVGPS